MNPVSIDNKNSDSALKSRFCMH